MDHFLFLLQLQFRCCRLSNAYSPLVLKLARKCAEETAAILLYRIGLSSIQIGELCWSQRNGRFALWMSMRNHSEIPSWQSYANDESRLVRGTGEHGRTASDKGPFRRESSVSAVAIRVKRRFKANMPGHPANGIRGAQAQAARRAPTEY